MCFTGVCGVCGFVCFFLVKVCEVYSQLYLLLTLCLSTEDSLFLKSHCFNISPHSTFNYIMLLVVRTPKNTSFFNLFVSNWLFYI